MPRRVVGAIAGLAVFLAGCGPDLGPVSPDTPKPSVNGLDPQFVADAADAVERGLFTDTSHLGKTLDDVVADYQLQTNSSYTAFRESLKDRKAIDDAAKADLAGKLRSILK